MEKKLCNCFLAGMSTMNNKLVSLAFLVVGIILVIYGLSALDSFSSDMSKFFTGAPTDKTIWLMIGGILAIVFGLAGLLRGKSG